MKTCEHTHFLASNHKTRDRRGGHWAKSPFDQYLHRMDRRRIRHNAKQSILTGLSDFEDEKSDADSGGFDYGHQHYFSVSDASKEDDHDDHNEREEQLRLQQEELYLQDMMELEEALPYNDDDVYGHEYYFAGHYNP